MEHKHCVRHLHNNFKKKNSDIVLKILLWVAARDTTMVWYNRHVDAMLGVSSDAVNWLARHEEPINWSRAHFIMDTKCDMLCNNLCESWNAAVCDCRDKPILVMFEMLRQNTKIRLANIRVAGMKWKLDIGPRIQKNMEKNVKRSREYEAFGSSDYVFEVHGKSGTILQS